MVANFRSVINIEGNYQKFSWQEAFFHIQELFFFVNSNVS